jgi:hypothetical protein
MAVGTKWVTICLEAISEKNEQERLKDYFLKTGKEVIELTHKQLEAFAGNILELESLDGKKKIIMSKTAYDSLDKNQINSLTSYGDICYTDIPVIEQIGGGGIRCLIMEIFLEKK